MLNGERRRAILEILKREGRVRVTRLAQQFKTSEVTIRKDLGVLHQQRRLHRTHGGALPAREGITAVAAVHANEQPSRKVRTSIAAAAARIVREGNVIVLGPGDITTAIARFLRHCRNLTVITNALSIVAELAGSSVELILIGGVFSQKSLSVVGPIAEEAFQDLSADLLFLDIDGLDLRQGLSTCSLLESRIHQAMIAVAGYRVAVCESGRVGRGCLSFVAPTSSVQEVITDQRISESDATALSQAGVKVTIV